LEIHGWKENYKEEEMRLEKSLATLPNSEEISIDNYRSLIDSLKGIDKYRNWIKKCKIHYYRVFVGNIRRYLIKDKV